MDLRESLNEFGKSINHIKEVIGEELYWYSNSIQIFIDEDNHITFFPSKQTGHVDCYRAWVDTD